MAASLELIEKLLNAGYSKEEIDKLTAEQDEAPEAEPKEDEAPEAEPKKEEDDFLADYKAKIEELHADLKKATEEVQKFNIRHSQQPEERKESAGDILYNAIANVIPPPGKEKE